MRHDSTLIPWSSGHWTHAPAPAVEQGTDLLVTAVEGSDAWRHTSYGFVHESEHALLAPFAKDSAVEVEFTAAFYEQFDQACIFIKVSDAHWIKAGVEYADGSAQLGPWAPMVPRTGHWRPYRIGRTSVC